METAPRPVTARSWLFAPGDSDRKMEKATAGDADAVIFDLEDAVSEVEKPAARARVAEFLAAQPGDRERFWVRINPAQSAYALDDLAAVMPARPGGIMLPKPRGREDAKRLHHWMSALEAAAGTQPGTTPVMMLATEEPSSLLHIGSYAGVPRIAAMSWGAEDLATAIGAAGNSGPYGGYDFTCEMARSLCLVGAAAAGVPAIETIHGDFRDLEGLADRAAKMRHAGFRGMLAIHPAQVPVINDAFTPGADEIEWAQEIVAVFAANPGAGTIGHKGQMLDRPHLARAEALLALAEKASK